MGKCVGVIYGHAADKTKMLQRAAGAHLALLVFRKLRACQRIASCDEVVHELWPNAVAIRNRSRGCSRSR